MIDLTVKTLDSQNHAFSLSDEITVREFKEHIAETVGVPADSQRLIYCGRVLQDEKRLNEYDVNGKVIHLVQRAPPQSTQRGNAGGQSHGQSRGRGDEQQPPRVRARQTRTQFHVNPMYLGSISIPAEVMDGHEWPIPQLSNTLSNSRLVVARRMLDQANRVLDRLENPTAAAAAANDSAVPESDEAASGAGAAASAAQQHDETVNRTERLLQQLSSAGGPMGGIFEIATAIAGSARPTYVWSSRTNSGEAAGPEPSAPTAETSDESQPSSQEQQPQPQPSRQGSANSSNDSAANARTTPPAAPQAPRPPQMAQLLGRLMETQDRLRPFLTRYRELMDLDPEIPGGRGASGEDIGTVEDNQRIADGVTECFHFLSHANHALSDIIVDMGQQPPRNLRCRPMLIQHSAILQSGIPISVEARISVARNDGSNGESGEENGDAASRPPTSAAATPPTSQHPIDLTFMTEQQDEAPPAEGQQPEQQQQQAQNQPQADSPFGAIFNITNNMEVLMEMGPPDSSGQPGSNGASGTGTEQNQTNGSNNNNNNNNNNNAPGTSGVAGIFPWGAAAPPDVIRNLMHVVAGYMAQSAAAVTTVATTTSTATPTSCLRQRVAVGVGGGAAPNPGQSTQARSNVGTHPTTSTQTRSTPRPHVFHPHPLGVSVGMGQNLDFDPFLPCNSHHIRRTPSATPTNSAATSSPQQPAQQQFNPLQPMQNATSGSAAQTQSDSPSAPADRDSPLSPTSPAQRGSYVSLRDEIANLRGSTGSRLNDGESDGIFSLEHVLLARGINNVLWSVANTAGDPSPRRLQRLLRACADIEVSEWFAFLENGEFNRDDVWRRLRPQITAVLLPFVSPNAIKDILAELRPYLSYVFKRYQRDANVREGRRIDLLATVGAVVLRHAQIVIRYIEINVNAPYDDEWGRVLVRIVRDFGRELCSVLHFALRTEQQGLEAVIRLFAEKVIAPYGELREWVLGSVVNWFCEYSRQVERLPNSQIVPLFVYSEDDEVAGSVENAEAAGPRETQSQPEPEPMETEEASSNRTINDPLDLDDGEEVPTSFPGHEELLPEWVPIIARDGIRQRRQLQLQGGGVTAFSDAYLDGLPSKRRKLVEQQKPRLLVSPTPNHSSIPASMERLVRESVVRAGVEEAEGAAAAVAADPGVRRAFGQAIRDCLNPRRLQTPDFPDARHFPNATRYFTEKDRPPKQ